MVQASRVAAVLAAGFCLVVVLQLRAVLMLLSTPLLPESVHIAAKGPLHATFFAGGTASSSVGSSSSDLLSLERRIEQVVAHTKAQIATGGGDAASVLKAAQEIEQLKAEMEHKMKLLEGMRQQQKDERKAVVAAAAVSAKERAQKSGNAAANAAVVDAAAPNSYAQQASASAIIAGVNDGSTMYAPTAEQRMLGLDSPLLVLCYSRDDYLTRTLSAILKYHPSNSRSTASTPRRNPVVPIVVSQDGNIDKVNRAIEAMRAKFFEVGIPFAWLKHPKAVGARNGYEKLAQHFGWAFQQIFSNDALRGTDIFRYPSSNRDIVVPRANRLIVLEEDIEIAPDFFGFFGAMAPLLDADDKLFSVSAWNDNGFETKVEGAHPESVVRSDFFPGLGWMMNRDLWMELGSRWPSGYWDDWIREPAQRRGREVLRPEICRTYHFGAEGGTSAGQFNAYLKTIRLNNEIVDWQREDLRYLSHDVFVKTYKEELEIATVVRSLQDVERLQAGVPGHLEERYYRIEYNGVTGHGSSTFMSMVGGCNKNCLCPFFAASLTLCNSIGPALHDKRFIFCAQAKKLGVMDNEKAMVPRGAFKGVLQFRHAGGIVLLSPPPATIDWESCGGRCS